MHPQVKLSQQLNEPLVHQRFGHENQYARGAAGNQLAMHDESRLDGFAQTHFVREQHARG